MKRDIFTQAPRVDSEAAIRPGTQRLRDLAPGMKFRLKRTGDRYLFVRREYDTPGGTRYVVQRLGFGRATTLHHSCHVEIIE